MCRDHTFSRRDFLKTGAAGVAGTTLLSACSPSAGEKPPGERKFVFRTLGRTGIKLPVVSMGTTYAINLVRAAIDEGIVYIHTSSSYSERNHERMLGEALSQLPRDRFVIATSPDIPFPFVPGRGRSLDLPKDANPSLVAESMDNSLRLLKLDHVDIYYLPSIASRENALREPFLRAFEKLKQSGKTRFIGIGTHSNEPEVIRAAADSGFWDVVLTAFNFRQSHRADVLAAIDQAAQAGLGVVAMKTQAGAYWDRERRRGINMKAALKWVLQHENVHTTIPAFTNFDQMREDLSVMENLTLTEEEKRDLNLGVALGLSGWYCQQCACCLPQCPAGMDIPAVLRASMYAFGYQALGKARATLRGWTRDDIPCQECTRCEVRCALGHDVRSRALDMARLLAV
jgi:uncharacterized protein